LASVADIFSMGGTGKTKAQQMHAARCLGGFSLCKVGAP
jgi:hypothetical protein